jgi:pyruvate kinase
MQPAERRAKIVATVGPASSDDKMLRRLLRAGVDVVRLNASHGSREQHRETIEQVHRLGEVIGSARKSADRSP